MPPSGDARNTGNWLAKPTDPSSSEDPVSRYTSQDWATLCIQVPIREMSCPLKKSWKLRWRKARRVAGSHTAFCADCPEFTDNHPIDPSEVPESVAFSLAVLTAARNFWRPFPEA